jgi:hypothetical protein
MSESEWDVEKYKTDYESDEHWELKKSFIQKNKSLFTEDEIICLAQVFFNVEMMGCKYSPEIMIQVAELSKGIIEEYRESRNGR